MNGFGSFQQALSVADSKDDFMQKIIEMPHKFCDYTCYVNGLEDVLAWKGGCYMDFLLSVAGGMASLARADLKLHSEALTKEGYDREIWRHKLAPLYDIMHAHWLKEEETKIPFGPEYFSKNEWEDFGKRFDEIVEEYLKKH